MSKYNDLLHLCWRGYGLTSYILRLKSPTFFNTFNSFYYLSPMFVSCSIVCWADAIKIKLKRNVKDYFFKQGTILAWYFIALAAPTPHLDALVTVCTVVDDRERLLEACTPDANDISNQLTDSNDHLSKWRERTHKCMVLWGKHF